MNINKPLIQVMIELMPDDKLEAEWQLAYFVDCCLFGMRVDLATFLEKVKSIKEKADVS